MHIFSISVYMGIDGCGEIGEERDSIMMNVIRNLWLWWEWWWCWLFVDNYGVTTKPSLWVHLQGKLKVAV